MNTKVDHMALLGVAVEPLGDIRSRLPQRRVGAEPVEPAHQCIGVSISLLEVPLPDGVDPDLGEIRFRPRRKPIDHFFASRSRPAALIRSASVIRPNLPQQQAASTRVSDRSSTLPVGRRIAQRRGGRGAGTSADALGSWVRSRPKTTAAARRGELGASTPW